MKIKYQPATKPVALSNGCPHDPPRRWRCPRCAITRPGRSWTARGGRGRRRRPSTAAIDAALAATMPPDRRVDNRPATAGVVGIAGGGGGGGGDGGAAARPSTAVGRLLQTPEAWVPSRPLCLVDGRGRRGRRGRGRRGQRWWQQQPVVPHTVGAPALEWHENLLIKEVERKRAANSPNYDHRVMCLVSR